MIKLVIFDMDGTLMDTETLSYECFRKACSEEGIELSRSFYASVVGSSHDLLKQRFIAEYGTQIHYDKIYQERNRLFYQRMSHEVVEIKMGYREIHQYLNENKIQSAVATSTPRKMTKKVLEAAGIWEDFTMVICGDEVRNGKPDPEIYCEVIKQIGVKPKEALILEDSAVGIKAACEAGAIPVMIPDLQKIDEETQKIIFYTATSMKDVIKVIEEENAQC